MCEGIINQTVQSPNIMKQKATLFNIIATGDGRKRVSNQTNQVGLQGQLKRQQLVFLS